MLQIWDLDLQTYQFQLIPTGKPRSQTMKPQWFNRAISTASYLVIIWVTSLLVSIPVIPLVADAQETAGLDLGLMLNRYSPTRNLAAANLAAGIRPDETSLKEENCLKTARLVGAISGSTMGLLHISWRAAGVSGIHGPFWKSLVAGVPSSIIGAYVGTRTTEWAARQIMKGNPEPGEATLKGAWYGAIDGAAILATSLVPLLIIGHYTDSIHFNMSDDFIALKLVGACALGGIIYGGTLGAVVGAVSGPCISWYMEF